MSNPNRKRLMVGLASGTQFFEDVVDVVCEVDEGTGKLKRLDWTYADGHANRLVFVNLEAIDTVRVIELVGGTPARNGGRE